MAQNPNSGVSQNALLGNTKTTAVNPLDQLSSTAIAVHAARMVNLPEATAVTNQSDSEANLLSITPADNILVAKPQVVNTSTKSARDIKVYTTVAGDTFDGLATKFSVTSDSIRWSNSLSGNTIPAGKTLYIPPVNGIVYVVKAGDTVESIAQKFGANKDSIIADNDAEVSGLKVDQRILVRDGVLTAARPRGSGYSFYSGFSFGNSPIYGYNGYDYGYCTWYVASRISMPSNWGNANTWDSGARASGWTLSKTPIVGAIAQTDAGGLGHVAVVDAVSEDGTMIKYSDMNGLAGWGRVGHSDWVSASGKYNWYIYR